MTELLAPLRPALRELVRSDRSKITAVTAFQNAIGTAVPLAVGAATEHLVSGLAASIGALNVCFSDLPGPYRLRAGRMLVVPLVGTISALIGGVAGALKPYRCCGVMVAPCRLCAPPW